MSRIQTRAKVNAFFDEFPYLRRYFDPEEITEVSVKRWDPNLLHIYPRTQTGGLDWRNTLFLLNGNHELVAMLGVNPRKLDGWLLELTKWFFPSVWFKPSVEKGLSELSDSDKERTTVIIGQTRSYNCYGYHCIELTVWKAPKGVANLAEWLPTLYEESYRKEKAELSKV